jgi:alkylation response protein AidB-like acyl-CoA dehydrogenase
VLLPIDLPGDAEGRHFEHGTVRTPRGYKEAYKQFVAGGWPGLCAAVEDGGQGLPFLLNAALYEMLNAASQAWSMYPVLTHGAYACIRAHGTSALKETHLPEFVKGDWLTTMCLTEPQAGSPI